MIKLEGSYLEGGGQIVRTALALSTITLKPFEINNIRKGRCDSGLKAQHLHCVKALELLCNAKTEGVKLGSEYLKYIPNKIEGKDINIDVGTSGSISLLLQAVLLPCLFANKTIRLKIIGGSDGKWAAPYNFFEEIFIPQIRRFCNKIDIKLIKRGYYPKGGGIVEIKVNPKYKLSDYKNFDVSELQSNSEHVKNHPIKGGAFKICHPPQEVVFNEFLNHLKNENLDYNLINQYNLIQIKGISHASLNLQKANVAERQAKAAKYLLTRYNCPIEIRTEYCNTLSPGSGITLWAIFSKNPDDIDEKNPIRLGADALGELGKKAEIVGKEAAENLIKEIESKAPVDKHLADQILPFMALTKDSKIKVSKITNHCRTNIYAIEQFFGKIFDINEKEKIISIKK